MDAPDTLTPLAANQDLLVGVAPFAIGLVVVAVLILAVAYGMRLRGRGDMRPSGQAPDRPRHARARDGRRRLPHEVRDQGVTAAGGSQDEAAEPARRHEGSGAAFGGGFGSRG